MKALEWTQHFPHYNSMVAMETSGRIWPSFGFIQALIYVLITCTYEKNPIKNSGENVMTSFPHYKSMGIFPDAQGQLTPQSLVRSGRISNSSEMLWMFSLPASMKKIRSKMKALEWTQHFPHYNPMGAFCCHGLERGFYSTYSRLNGGTSSPHILINRVTRRATCPHIIEHYGNY